MKIEAYYHPKEMLDPGLVLNYCGVEYCNSGFSMPPHTRDVYLIHYLFEGKCNFTSMGKTVTLSEGNVFTIFPGQVVSYKAIPNEPCNFCWIAISGDRTAMLMNRIGFHENQLVGKLVAEYSILDLVTNCAKLIELGRPGLELALHANTYTIFSYMEQSLFSDGANGRERKMPVNEHIAKAKAYIKFHYMNQFSVTDLAAHVGLERTYFSKIFKRGTGQPPQNYILNYRINSAKELLEATSYSCKEISGFVGFIDEHYFSRSFKSKLGVSPRKYREIYSNNS